MSPSFIFPQATTAGNPPRAGEGSKPPEGLDVGSETVKLDPDGFPLCPQPTDHPLGE